MVGRLPIRRQRRQTRLGTHQLQSPMPHKVQSQKQGQGEERSLHQSLIQRNLLTELRNPECVARYHTPQSVLHVKAPQIKDQEIAWSGGDCNKQTADSVWKTGQSNDSLCHSWLLWTGRGFHLSFSRLPTGTSHAITLRGFRSLQQLRVVSMMISPEYSVAREGEHTS
jgi:hypothetical protein